MMTIQEPKKLRTVFSLSDGVFSRLRTKSGIPWGSDATLAGKLDLMYLYNHSGDRFVSPVLDLPDNELTTAHKDQVIDAVWSINKVNWEKLWEVLTAEYDPIQNYSMTEMHTGTDTDLDTPTNWQKTNVKTPNQWKTTIDHKASQDYKETETQTPTDWETETVHSNTNYHETETKTPTDWETETVHSATNYHETETKTPTDWEREIVHSNDQYTETNTDTPTNWTKTTESDKADNISETGTSVYGFNSSEAVPSAKTKTELDSKTEETQRGTYERTKEITGSQTDTETQTGTFETDLTVTGSKTDTETQSGTFETDLEISGSKTDTTTQSGTFATTKEMKGVLTDEHTQSGTFTETDTQNGTYEKKTTYNTTLTRSGNIGVTTSQQLIQSSVDLYSNWSFFETVFRDLDKILTLSTY